LGYRSIHCHVYISKTTLAFRYIGLLRQAFVLNTSTIQLQMSKFRLGLGFPLSTNHTSMTWLIRCWIFVTDSFVVHQDIFFHDFITAKEWFIINHTSNHIWWIVQPSLRWKIQGKLGNACSTLLPSLPQYSKNILMNSHVTVKVVN
jgi:hypothetical protein